MDNFYEGYERLEDFTPDGLVAYRKHLLEKTKLQVEFIRKHVWSKFERPLTVVEVGSGNGRFIISLALHGLLYYGLGIDLSHSRTAFARDWLNLVRTRENMYFRQGNILNEYPIAANLAVCITGCLQYFSESQAQQVLEYMRRSSEFTLLELYNRPPNSQSWHELPAADRFAYLLDDYSPGNPTIHTKTFIKRDGTIDQREESLYYYGYDEFRNLLRLAGFTNIHWDVEDATKRVVLVS